MARPPSRWLGFGVACVVAVGLWWLLRSFAPPIAVSSARRVDIDGELTPPRQERVPAAPFASAPSYHARELELTEPGTAPRLLTLDAARGGTVSGYVLDASGGPVAGARVTARASAGEGESLAVAQSDAQGAFRLEVAARHAELSARAEAYSFATRSVEVPAAGVSLVLAPGASVCGRVIEQGSGRAVEGTTVHAQNTNGLRAETLPVSTHANGEFCFEALTPGDYELWVAGSGWRSERAWQVVGPAQRAADVTLAAVVAGSLEALIRAGGEPCAEGSVELVGPGGARFFERARGGQVVFEGMPLGAYTASVYCDAAAPLREPLELGVAPVARNWELDAGLELRGRVRRASGGPLAAIGVFASPNAALAEAGAAPLRAVSDERGEFHVGGLLAGEYTLSIDGPAHSAAPPRRVQVSEHTTRVELVAGAEASIQAELLATAAKPPLVFARHEDMNYPFPAERREDRFVFEHLPLGRYAVFSGSGDVVPEGAAHVELRADGEVATVRVEVTGERHAISGRVVDEEGAPVLDAWVTARPAQPLPFVGPSDNDPVLTNGQGEFTLAGLWAGRYRVEVSSEQGQAVAPDVAAGAEVVVRVPRDGVLSGSPSSTRIDPAGPRPAGARW